MTSLKYQTVVFERVQLLVLQEYYSYRKQNKVLIVPLRTASYAMPKEKCFDSFDIEFASTINIKELKSVGKLVGYMVTKLIIF